MARFDRLLGRVSLVGALVCFGVGVVLAVFRGADAYKATNVWVGLALPLLVMGLCFAVAEVALRRGSGLRWPAQLLPLLGIAVWIRWLR